MQLRWIEDYVTLCATRSFSETARRRSVSQSALSKHIRSLEDWLGSGALIDRSSSPVQITDTGATFRQTAIQISALLQAARNAKNTLYGTCRTLLVSTTPSLSRTFSTALPGMLDASLRRSARLCFLTNDFDEALASYQRGDCDALLRYKGRADGISFDDSRHVNITVATEHLVPVSIPAPNNEPYFDLSGPADNPLPYLGYTDKSYLGWMLRSHEAFSRLSGRLRRKSATAYPETLRSAVMAGLGVAWLPTNLIKGDLANHRLVLAGRRCDHIPLTIEFCRRRDAGYSAANIC